MPYLACHKQAERLSFLSRSLNEETAWTHEVTVAFPLLEQSPEAESRRKPEGEGQFLRECRQALKALPRSSDLSQTRKALYRGLVEGCASKIPMMVRLNLNLTEFKNMWKWSPGKGLLDNAEFSLTWRVFNNGLTLNNWTSL